MICMTNRLNILAVRRWHVGKIVMLWAWGVAVMALIVKFLKSIDNPILGFGLIVTCIGIPFILSLVTWQWLGGKEHSRHPH
jgi:hypothetical protein